MHVYGDVSNSKYRVYNMQLCGDVSNRKYRAKYCMYMELLVTEI